MATRSTTAWGEAAQVRVEAAPAELEREPLIAHNRSIGWLSDTIAGVAEGVTPFWWKIAFRHAASQ